jgi:hypothetical protein
MIPILDPDEVEGEFDLIEYLENRKQFAGKVIPAIYQMIQSQKPLAEGERYNQFRRLERMCEKAADAYDVELSSD